MKNRFLIALPMAVSLMVPAALAQSSDASAALQSSSSQATQTSQPGDDLGPHQPLQPETRQGFWGKMNPFARKKYVQNQLSPIRNRVNELDELTAKNSTMLKDVAARRLQRRAAQQLLASGRFEAGHALAGQLFEAAEVGDLLAIGFDLARIARQPNGAERRSQNSRGRRRLHRQRQIIRQAIHSQVPHLLRRKRQTG